MSEVDSVGKALDRIDSLRRRAQIAALLAMMAAVGAIGWLGRVTQTTDDIEVVIRSAVQAGFIVTLATGFMVMFWVSHMTLRILRAIQLTSPRSNDRTGPA